MPSPPTLSRAIAAGSGGNAEALARIAAGPMVGRTPTINVRLLKDQTLRILRLDVPGRMRAFRVRKDRAEVVGIAGIIIGTVAKWLDLRSILVPGVGVREGLLLDLVAEQYSGGETSAEEKDRAEELLAGTRWFARRLNYDAQHAEQVSRLALSLFDQLRPIHELGPEHRLLLEIAAMLHDIGHFVHRKSHNRHGEYLIRNSEIPGLRGWRRDMVGGAGPLPQLQIRAADRARLLRRARRLAAPRAAAAHVAPAHRGKTGIGARAARGGRRRADRRASRDFPDPRGRGHAA